MPAPRETAAQVWINGQPRGVFEIEEVWGKEALTSRFPDPNGPLYRIRGLTNTGSVRIQGRGSGGVRAAALGSGRTGDARPGRTRSSAPRCRWWRKSRRASAR